MVRNIFVIDNPMPEVSVILPVFNSQDTLTKSIQSIANQSFKDLELIVVNNGCTDNSVKIIRDLKQHDVRIKLIHENRRGVVHAANTGIKHAQGRYLVRMDADDEALPERIACQVEFLRTNPGISAVSGLIIPGVSEFDNRGFTAYIDWLNGIRTPEQIHLNQFVEYPVANPSLTWRREAFDMAGNYSDGNFPEDYELFLRMQETGQTFSKIRRPVLVWNDRKTRLTRTDPRYSAVAFQRIKSGYLARWLTTHNPFHPEVMVWGAGRLARKWSRMLSEKGITIQGYIDVDPRKSRQENIIHYTQIPRPEECFIVSYVSNRGKREEVRDFLRSRGYQEGKSFILAA